MRRICKRIAALGMTLLLGGTALSFAAFGMRSYDCETPEYAAFSREVSAFEESGTHEPQGTVIVRTDGTKPDFRALHPQFTVKGPDNAYAVCFADAAQAEQMRQKVEELRGVEYAECNGEVTAQQAQALYPEKISWGRDYMQLDRFAARIRENLLEDTDEVIVAIVDSGIAATHPLFTDRLVDGESFTSASFNEDLYGHGTSVAGVVADCTDGLPVKLMSIKILRDSGTATLLTAANGIRSAVDHGADIINLSFVSETCSVYLHEAVDYALEKESLPVICAGNYSTDMDRGTCCPAHLQEAVVVSGFAADESLYRKSGFGSCIDLSAPAVDVLCAENTGGYILRDGTSFAAPHIAAVAAMYKLMEPQADCARLTQLLKSSVRDLGAKGFDTLYGWGVPWFGKVAVSMEINALPKTQYYYKDTFCADGLSLRVTYDDGSVEEHTDGYTLTGTEDLHRGDNTVGVEFGACTGQFTVHVKLHWWQWIIWTVLFGFLWY